MLRDFLVLVLILFPVGLVLENLLLIFFDVPTVQFSSYWMWLSFWIIMTCCLIALMVVLVDSLALNLYDHYSRLKSLISEEPTVDVNLHHLIYSAHAKLGRFSISHESWVELLAKLTGFAIIALIGLMNLSLVIDMGVNGSDGLSILIDQRAILIPMIPVVTYGLWDTFIRLKSIIHFSVDPAMIFQRSNNLSEFNKDKANEECKRIFGVELKKLTNVNLGA